MPIWTDTVLAKLTEDAEIDICNKVVPIFHRFSLSVVSGTAVYTLPDHVKEIIRITWKGKPLDPMGANESRILRPQYLTEEGEPREYMWVSDGLLKLRLIPVPNETIAADDTNIDGLDIKNRVIISCYRDPDTTLKYEFHIPKYIARRTVKNYVLKQAFLMEGPGQNIKASQYYSRQYDNSIELYKQIKARYFSAKIRSLEFTKRVRPARPVLPTNFGHRI